MPMPLIGAAGDGSSWRTGDGFSGRSGSIGSDPYGQLIQSTPNSLNSAATINMDFDSLANAIYGANAAANAFNAEEAQKNRDFQLYLSNTSHQREMQDLAAAGLNPILAARQGASTPSGSAASGESTAGAIAGLLGQIISANSAQAIANRNNATSKLIEQMREGHDLRKMSIGVVSNLFSRVLPLLIK